MQQKRMRHTLSLDDEFAGNAGLELSRKNDEASGKWEV
jgi:hypothetical protein